MSHDPDDVRAARALAPWYHQEVQPSVLDMFAKLRRVLVAAHFRRADPGPLTAADPRQLTAADPGLPTS